MNDENTLEEEFNRIFGSKVYKSLFLSDDEYYNTLRQEIINSPLETYDKKIFPFADVSLVPYHVFKKNKLTQERQNPDSLVSIDDLEKKKEVLGGIIESLYKNKLNDSPIFYIKGNCIEASGYFEPKTQYFYILANSKISVSESKPFQMDSILLSSRNRLIEKVCVRELTNYRVKINVKCRSARAAACYVLGKVVSSGFWIDKYGNNLGFYYPEYFSSDGIELESIKEKVTIGSKYHLFFIKKGSSYWRHCEAKGYYEQSNNKFVLKAGSLLTLLVADSYEYSSSYYIRNKIIEEYCHKENNGYRLTRDYVCDSPSGAASLCLGRNANGWQEWIDEEGKTLRDIYKTLKTI